MICVKFGGNHRRNPCFVLLSIAVWRRTKRNQLWVPTMVETGLVVLVLGKILKMVSLFSLSLLSPLRKKNPIYLNKCTFPQSKHSCVKFGWNWPSGYWEEDENVKNWRTNGWTIRKAHLNIQLWLAKKECFNDETGIVSGCLLIMMLLTIYT